MKTNTTLMVTAGLAMQLGCAPLARKQEIVSLKLAEESKALTTGVVELLQATPAEGRGWHEELALELAKQDQRIEGLPVNPIDALALGSTNEIVRSRAREEFEKRVERQEGLIGKRARAELGLQKLGVEAELAAAARKKFWTKAGLVVGVPLAGLVALWIFVPVSLPICGRLLGWMVGRIPSLAGALGVVSVKAFDAVVLGIEKARGEWGGGAPAGLEGGARVGIENSRRAIDPDFFHKLEERLGREMDREHKSLVRRRKQALGMS